MQRGWLTRNNNPIMIYYTAVQNQTFNKLSIVELCQLSHNVRIV